MSPSERVSSSIQQTLNPQLLKSLTKKRATLRKHVTLFSNYLSEVRALTDNARPNKAAHVVFLDFPYCGLISIKFKQKSKIYKTTWNNTEISSRNSIVFS